MEKEDSVHLIRELTKVLTKFEEIVPPHTTVGILETLKFVIINGVINEDNEERIKSIFNKPPFS